LIPRGATASLAGRWRGEPGACSDGPASADPGLDHATRMEECTMGDRDQLQATVDSLVQAGKGILAADER
jgi:hypothetical protein